MVETKSATKEKVTVLEAAQILNISPDTIRKWEKKKLIRVKRSENDHRLFDLQELKRIQKKYLGLGNNLDFKVLKGKKTKFNVIELFSGCGGMALGFENAGLTTELLVEIDKNSISTLRANRPAWKVKHQDIAQVDFTQYKNKIDIVAGGPPCQAFSYAGHSRGFEDTRGTLFFELARCVKEVQPKIAVIENVRGLIRHDEGKTLSTMLRALEDLGYEPAYELLRAQFLDVPQKRERLVIIAVRKDLNVPALFPKEKNYTVSIREALKNCPPSDGANYPKRKREILELVPPGGCWRDLPIDIQKEYMKKSFYLGGGKTGMARRLSWDEPSLTLTCSPAQKQTERCHPQETRPLKVREYARIQSFPDDWQFTGSLASQYRQIGNAVPVNLAYYIGKCLISMLEANLKTNIFMSKYNLGFISDEAILSHVTDTVEKYRFSINLKQFNKNLIDPIKLTFDAKIYNKSISEIIESEVLRQIDKSNTNHIGYFHQNIFNYFGDDWLVPKSGYDIVNSNKKIYVEMKNKHNTMNSSSSKNTYIRMQNTLLNDPEATCMLVEVIARKSQNIPWKTSIDNQSVTHERIRRVSIDKFYEIVSGDKYAFKKLCEKLPKIIFDCVDGSQKALLKNTVFDELLSISPNLVKSIYLLSFAKYEGFNELEIEGK